MAFIRNWIFIITLSIPCCIATFFPGDSLLGTLGASLFPPFLTNNPLPDGFPWKLCSANNTDPKDAPNTGVTRYYDFTIKRGKAAPDGYEKEVILINGEFPAPTIEANWGDWIEVKVKNEITGPEEGTSLHWHGLFQKETPWYDGVPSITQCPIAPRATFTYRFRADVYGTTWYHAHYSAQYSAGLTGALIIYGPSHIKYDEDLGPIMLQDWYHKDYYTVVEGVMSNDTALQEQFSDNTIINGRMPYDCSLVTDGTPCSQSTYSKFRVTPGKTYKLRLINTAAGGWQHFSIDGHNLTIVANDFVAIHPYSTTIVTLGIGQRSDVLFTPIGNATDAVWMRTNQYADSCARALQPEGKAIILYDKAPEDSIPVTEATPIVDDGTCRNDPLNMTVPYYPSAPPEPSVTYNITINQVVNSTGHNLFYMNGSPFQANYNNPILLLANEKNYSYPYDPQWNVINLGSNSSVRINVWNNNTVPHPMHLHGHDMWILNDGLEQWDGTVVNPQNPQRRDTQNLAPNGHIVFQYNLDNPGVWLFHCHLAWHLSSGLSVSLLERPKEINQFQIPFIMAQTCVEWDIYTAFNTVDQIDSGV
ncbi:hypothetical protein GMDG_06756 [Pseudogymnoascus destructans 20631-21]|uniref:Laccase, multicopper oxidase, benzenediol:oxygen oxidorectuctase n=1 Tax=Pseudogymnoascus destructans (strain ATCC MYA-4855 / 20631-21) TaxID=658429 RepID=L8FVD7_PSED2|nr:hypothetical protein GMDG_06756 [Pseudogymnoascus destructans 20631-21]